MTNNTKTYDLEERIAKFGESIIDSTRATLFRESRRWQIAVSKEVTP